MTLELLKKIAEDILLTSPRVHFKQDLENIINDIENGKQNIENVKICSMVPDFGNCFRLIEVDL